MTETMSIFKNNIAIKFSGDKCIKRLTKKYEIFGPLIFKEIHKKKPSY